MTWSWFGVKTIYQTTVAPPLGHGRRKQNKASDRLVEERIVLLKARSAEEAIAKAEREAALYAEGPRYRNRSGDLVRLPGSSIMVDGNNAAG